VATVNLCNIMGNAKHLNYGLWIYRQNKSKRQRVFKKCYFDESWYSVSLDEGTLAVSDRKLSTNVNALAKAGFVIEQMIEQSDDEIMQSHDANSDFANKAKMLPVTFVIKARKR